MVVYWVTTVLSLSLLCMACFGFRLWRLERTLAAHLMTLTSGVYAAIEAASHRAPSSPSRLETGHCPPGPSDRI